MTEIDAPPHPFDAAIALTPVADGRMRSRTRPEYANMVGPFGGITAAALVQAVQRHPDRLGDPISLTVNYAAPIADGDFDITARAVRTNRTNQHWLLELTQDGVVTTTATAVFGVHRDTWSDTELDMPRVPSPDAVPLRGFPDFIAWARNYEMRFVEGAVPDQDAGEHPDSTTTLWVRDAPARPLDFPALTALCDVFYPGCSCGAAGTWRPAPSPSPCTSTPTPRRSRPKATTTSWAPRAPTASHAATSTRPPRCGAATAPSWRPPTNWSTSRTDPPARTTSRTLRRAKEP